MPEPTITKQCTKCKQIKPLGEFHKRSSSSDGYRCACKQCRKKDQVTWYEEKGGRAYKKRYRQTEQGKEVHRRESRKYRQSKKGKISQKRGRLKYDKTEKGKAQALKNRQKWIKEKGKEYQRNAVQQNLNQYKAYQSVRTAIEKGELPKPSTLPCKFCFDDAHLKSAEEYHHHKGYAREHWLDVIPLCKKCHSSYHVRLSLSK